MCMHFLHVMITSQDWQAAVFKLEKVTLLCEEQVCSFMSGATFYSSYAWYYHDLRNLLEMRQADIKRKCLKLWKVCLQWHVNVCYCCFTSLYTLCCLFTSFQLVKSISQCFVVCFCFVFPIYTISLMMKSEKLIPFENTK